MNNELMPQKNIDVNSDKEDAEQVNNLFPAFIKLQNFRLLIIGGGNVALEKLNTVLENSPKTSIRLISISVKQEIYELAKKYPTIKIELKPYVVTDLENIDIVIAAVNDIPTSKQISDDARSRGILVNVADKPELCDFYLGSIVKKGNLKIAISTNGKSPTIAKRLKEVIDGMIPAEMDGVLDNMQVIRGKIDKDFHEKVKQLNDLTKVLVAKKVDLDVLKAPEEKKWQKIVKWCLLAFILMLVGHAIFSYIPYSAVADKIREIPEHIDKRIFLLMVLTGFLAQMVDGSLGMGYGTISTVFLLAIGVPPAIVSSRVHSARVFSSGVSGYSHHRFGNINKKLFKTLVIPGIIGAVAGASCAYLCQKHPDYALWVRLILTFYTAYLGYYIIRKAFVKTKIASKVKGAGWLASAGGFLDAFAGGGWGALVTSTLIAKRRDARYVIGSVCLAEFFVVLFSAITFFILLENLPIFEILGLIIGGVIAAPIAARLVGKLPLKATYAAVGIVVILTSGYTFWNVIHKIALEFSK